MCTVRVRLFSDGSTVLIEVWDQASGYPAPRRAAGCDGDGRGLQLVDAVTCGRWGWQPGQGPAKVVWAELAAELADPEHKRAPPDRREPAGRLAFY
jgi:hypothetical protein